MTIEETFEDFVKSFSFEKTKSKYDEESKILIPLAKDIFQTQGDNGETKTLFLEAKRMGFSEFSLGFHIGIYFRGYQQQNNLKKLLEKL